MPRQAKKKKGADAAQAVQPEPAARVRAKRRGAGGLEGLLDMPLDIVVEILAYLEPLDLLHLARTSKPFRAVLMNRHNAFMWRTARGNVEGLPGCPPGVCEPAFANFLFCTFCHECGKPKSVHIYWDCMSRFCRKCEVKIHKWEDKHAVSDQIDDRVEKQFLSVKFEREIKHVTTSQFMRMWCKEPVIKEVSEWHAWEYFGYALQSDFLRTKALLASMSVEERTGYIAAQVYYTRQWRELVPTLVRWFKSQEAARKDELHRIRLARQQEVTRRLFKMGWKDEILAMTGATWSKLTTLPAVQQPKQLTDRVWERVSPAVLERIEQVKTERLHQERLLRLQARLRTLDRALLAHYTYRPGEPSELDIALGILRVREVVDAAPDAAIDEASFGFLQDALPPFIAEWKQQRDTHLAALVTQDLGELAPGTDPLALAVACRFTCTACGNAASHAQTHRCRLVRPSLGPDIDAVYAGAAAKHLAPQCWNPAAVKSNVTMLAPIVRLLGLDPAVATVDDMEAVAGRLACKLCDSESSVTVMDWFAAFRHALSSHADDDDALAGLYVVPKEHAVVAAALEPAYLQHAPAARLAVWWHCGRCTQKASTRSCDRRAIVQHLRTKHDVKTPKMDEHFWADDENARRSPRGAQVHLLRGTAAMDNVLGLPDELQDALKHGYARFCDFL
ncbi:F-box protein [Phanerochaete sordida]|uniref:F-box protein n=1 Tax=Phanerochaete sordida TaxID=48140 RepID=A0A9P3G829_9APHY|nr:F-box protein [Phanerochaete sordida]